MDRRQQDEIEPASYAGRHVDSAAPATWPSEFRGFLKINFREVLFIVFGCSGATVGGIAQACSPNASSSAKWVGVSIAVAGLVVLASYALRFYPDALGSPWWLKSQFRRGLRHITGGTWVVAVGGFYVAAFAAFAARIVHLLL